MCSFLFSTDYQDSEDLNYYLKFRGPDLTNKVKINDHLFVHNLLSITGDLKPQPFQDENIVLMYNGEIYNYKEFGDYNSDGECLIPLYKKYGVGFIKHLDGEFAICLVDYNRGIIVLGTDTFKTKPMFVGFKYGETDGHVGVSTYKTPLEKMGYTDIQKVGPNSITTITLGRHHINFIDVHKFDLEQKKDNYDDWIAAFKNAINKRVFGTNKNIFIGLSSGYDSGIIYNELLRTGKEFHTFSLTGTENQNIIDARLKLNNGKCISQCIPKTDGDKMFSHILIKKNTEPFKYTIQSDGYTEHINLIDDGGSNNFATICRAAKKKNCKICLSGTGADEIISDYGFNGKKYFPHSNFGGLFPDNLSSIFPWNSFYGSTMESYIAKEEYVGGSFGIEMRYPFLDKQVVQEFLWLKPELKNMAYKAPIEHYFKLNNFPYEKEIKRGF